MKQSPNKQFPMENHPAGWVWENQRPFLTLDTEKEVRYPEFMQRLLEAGVHSFALVPLTTAQHRLGAMAIGRFVPHGMTDAELDFVQRVAKQVAVAVDNALNFEAAQAYQAQLARERDRLQVLLNINNLLVSTRDTGALFRGIVSSLKPVFLHDYTSLALLDNSSGLLKILALDMPDNAHKLPNAEFTVSVEDTPAGQAFSSGQVLVVRGAELNRYNIEVIRFSRKEGVQVMCCVPFRQMGARSGRLIWPAANPMRSLPRTLSCSNKSPPRSRLLWKMRWHSGKSTR